MSRGYFELFLCLSLISLTMGCKPEPSGLSITPTLTVFAERPDKPSQFPKPTHVPSGMVYVPAGVTFIGADDGMEWEKPRFWVQVKPFLMDEHPVTVAEFRKFITATGYKTQAEKFGDGGVFDEESKAWLLIRGAYWAYPQGRNHAAAEDNHPVTQVSWHDAQAYARWAGKRLPSEFEWEHAARNATNSQSSYPFGDALQTGSGKYLANTWNGSFPDKNSADDGFRYTSPVGYFGKTPLGLTDMAGNVWQWCSDWKQNYADVVVGKAPNHPTEKVQRGGSFLCEPGWCHGYRVSGRSFTSPETGLMHVGFRCVKDIPNLLTNKP